MKLFSRLRGHRYCAYCKTKRRIYVKKHIDLTNVLAVGLLALAATHVYFGEPDPSGLALFSVFIFAAEIFVYLRWRSSITCRLCGFDPVIYKRSPEKAKLLVGEFFKQQVEDPSFWLSKSPLLEVQKRLRTKERSDRDRANMSLRQQSKSVARPPTLR